jgi:hypothetical protein
MLKIMWFNLNQGRGVIYNSIRWFHLFKLNTRNMLFWYKIPRWALPWYIPLYGCYHCNICTEHGERNNQTAFHFYTIILMLKIMWFNLNQGRGVIYNSVSGWSLLHVSYVLSLCCKNGQIITITSEMSLTVSYDSYQNT